MLAIWHNCLHSKSNGRVKQETSCLCTLGTCVYTVYMYMYAIIDVRHTLEEEVRLALMLRISQGRKSKITPGGRATPQSLRPSLGVERRLANAAGRPFVHGTFRLPCSASDVLRRNRI